MFMLARSLLYASGPDGFKKWNHLSMIAWSWLRMLSRFSAVMFVGFIHPSIMFDALHKTIEKRKRDRNGMQWEDIARWHKVWVLARTLIGFLGSRLCLLMIGVVCVTVKVENVHFVIQNTMETPSNTKDFRNNVLSTVVVMMAFLNQMMNMLDISHRLRLRAMAFVFAGADGTYQREEMVSVAIYQANVAQKVWETFSPQGKFYALGVLFCFNHQDVQRCAVKDKGESSFDLSRQRSVSEDDMEHRLTENMVAW
jgi:hypothetical protein